MTDTAADGRAVGWRLAGRRITVVGAGPGGAAAALCFARAGAVVTLLERVAQPRAVGAGILLQPNGLAVLYGLGLERPLRALGCEASEAVVEDASGRTIMRTLAPDFGAGLDHALCVRRSVLQAALLDAVAAAPRIVVRFGVEVTAAERDARTAWRDQDGVTGELDADLVVAADGVHSRVRDGGTFGARITPGYESLRVIAPVASTPRFVEHWTPLGICGEGPVDGGTYLYATPAAPEVRAAVVARDLATLVRLYGAACPPAARILGAVGSFDEVLLNRVIRVDCRQWVDGRVVLIGDAAHGMAPNLGQGANSALVDAALLAAMLAGDGIDDAVLERWQRRRRGPVRAVQDAAGALAHVSGVRHASLRVVRDVLARTAARFVDGTAGIRWAQQEDPAGLRRTVEALGRAAVRGDDR